VLHGEPEGPSDWRGSLRISTKVTLAYRKLTGLTPDERLRLHQERSRTVMDKPHAWLEAQLE